MEVLPSLSSDSLELPERAAAGAQEPQQGLRRLAIGAEGNLLGRSADLFGRIALEGTEPPDNHDQAAQGPERFYGTVHEMRFIEQPLAVIA